MRSVPFFIKQRSQILDRGEHDDDERSDYTNGKYEFENAKTGSNQHFAAPLGQGPARPTDTVATSPVRKA